MVDCRLLFSSLFPLFRNIVFVLCIKFGFSSRLCGLPWEVGGVVDNDRDLTLFSLPTTLSVDLMYGDGATGSDIFLWTGLFLIAGFSVTDDRLSSVWTLLLAER